MEQTESSDQDNYDENSSYTESDDYDEIEPFSKRARTWPIFSSSSEQKSSSKTQNNESQASTTTNMSKQQLTPIDLEELAKKIKNILSCAKIHQKLFAEEFMGISFAALKKMINPRKNRLFKKWAECKNKTKRRYHIMHEWSQAPEKSIEHLNAMSIKEDDNEENIDPIMLANRITIVLDDAKISHDLFAKEILGVSRSVLGRILRDPKSWIQSSDSKRKHLKKLHEWIQSPKESIKQLTAIANGSDDEFIDTFELCDSVKNILNENKIPHKLFAEEVLGICKSRFCQIIKKPTLWHVCRDCGKDNYRKLNEWRKSATESIISLKALNESRKVSDCVEGEEILDTFELAFKANKLLKKLGISKPKLSRMLDICVIETRYLIHYPAPWNVLTQSKKEHYYKIHEWLLENEDEEDDGNSSASDEEGDEEMDTFKVSREIVQLLKTHGISHFFFATKTLRTPKIYFDELVTNKKPWGCLHESKRKIFRIIEQWTLAKSEEIKVLKQKNLNFYAKNNISTQNSYRRKKLLISSQTELS
jgi:hypothetical protein